MIFVLGLAGSLVCASTQAQDAPGAPQAASTAASDKVVCESKDNRRRHCPLEVGDGIVVLVRALSRAPCNLGTTWNFDARGVWVDEGCRGEFQAYPNDDLRR